MIPTFSFSLENLSEKQVLLLKYKEILKFGYSKLIDELISLYNVKHILELHYRITNIILDQIEFQIKFNVTRPEEYTKFKNLINIEINDRKRAITNTFLIPLFKGVRKYNQILKDRDQAFNKFIKYIKILSISQKEQLNKLLKED